MSMRNRRKKKSKMEFSKLHLIAVYIFVVAVTVFSCSLMWETKDTSALPQLLISAFGLLTAVGGFYSNKAKRENEIKLRKQYGAEIYNDVKDTKEDDFEI